MTVDVREVARGGSRVRLQVEDTMPAYRLVDASGAVAERRPGRPARRWSVTLEQVGKSWLVYDVVRG